MTKKAKINNKLNKRKCLSPLKNKDMQPTMILKNLQPESRVPIPTLEGVSKGKRMG